MKPINTQKALEIAQRFIPNPSQSAVAVAAPGDGFGFWVGASSAVEYDGVIYLAYRTRQPVELGRGQGVIIAKSDDGEHFETICQISKEDMDAESLERPTLVRSPAGSWHLYLSCATKGTKHWRVELLTASDPAAFTATDRKVVLLGDERWGVKDTVITIADGIWHLWATCHPLQLAEHEDRMVSKYASSSDGITWQWQDGTALTPRPACWDERGARVTAIHHVSEDDIIIAFYDGRASAAENYEERTGIAVGKTPDAFTIVGSETQPFAESLKHKAVRYLDIVPLANGQYRLYYEIARDDASHELRTQLV